MAELVCELSSWRAAGHAACVHSSDPTLRAMWPDGQQDITEVTKRPLTAGTLFKNSMVALVENLASKVQSPPLPSPWILPEPSVSWMSSWAPDTSVHHGEGGCSFPICCESYALQWGGTCHCTG